MAANAALLDELMGAYRNALPGQREAGEVEWKESNVCKDFLCGFCPMQLFTNTRADIGQCDKVHDERLRNQYLESGEQYKLGYEERFLETLQSLVRRLDRRLDQCEQRLSTSAKAKEKRVKEEVDPEAVRKIDEEIEKTLKEVEVSGNQGQVDHAQSLMMRAEQLKRDKERMLEKKPIIAGFETSDDFHEKMEVCKVCGCFLVINDAPQRIQSHLEGKQHMGYARIRSKIEELQKVIAGKQQAGGRSSPHTSASGDDERRREHNRPRERRESGHSREGRERDHSRERRERDRSKERDRSRERRRDADRSRDNSSWRREKKRSREREDRRERDNGREHRSHHRNRSSSKSSKRSRSRSRSPRRSHSGHHRR